MVQMTNCDQAQNLFNQGKFKEASEQFRCLASQSVDLLERASYLLDAANCYWRVGNFEEATACAAAAKRFSSADVVACAQVDFFMATLLIAQNKREQGVEELAAILVRYSDKLGEGEGRELYQQIQIQRGFSFMHLSRYSDARPLLEEAVHFQMPDSVLSDICCNLGRCYHELALYDNARQQFERAQALGVSEEWQPTFHYYFGYTLYELKDFAKARRELILCLQSGAGPPKAYTYEMLAATSRKLGEREEARAYDKMAKASSSQSDPRT